MDHSFQVIYPALYIQYYFNIIDIRYYYSFL